MLQITPDADGDGVEVHEVWAVFVQVSCPHSSPHILYSLLVSVAIVCLSAAVWRGVLAMLFFPQGMRVTVSHRSAVRHTLKRCQSRA